MDFIINYSYILFTQIVKFVGGAQKLSSMTMIAKLRGCLIFGNLAELSFVASLLKSQT